MKITATLLRKNLTVLALLLMAACAGAQTYKDLDLVPQPGEAKALCRNETLIIVIDIVADNSRFDVSIPLDEVCPPRGLKSKPSDKTDRVDPTAPLKVGESRVLCDGDRLVWLGIAGEKGMYTTEIDLTLACKRRYAVSS